MIKKITAVSLIFAVQSVVGQQIPTANTGGGSTNVNYWSREGNSSGQNNIFGTRFNSPIYTITGGLTLNTYRTKLNGNLGGGAQYPINGYLGSNGVNTSGYMLLGVNNKLSNGQSIYFDKGAFSLLHLNGPSNSPTAGVQETGYRPWMKTGITLTGNSDLMYTGIRRLQSGSDRTEFVTAWSDNAANGFPGPDDYVFRFTASGAGQTNYQGNYDASTDLDGRHVARFTGEGQFGLGPVFGVTTPASGSSNASPIYYRPTSIIHVGEDNYDDAWSQISNTQGTGMTQNDGLRLGISGNLVNNTLGYLRWQENRPFIIQTDWDNSAGGTEKGERIRITTINDVSANIPQPGLPITDNTTRVAISYSGGSPVSQPRSLLHLGFNAGNTNGWRNWMDIGTFTSNGADHVYMGLKQENNGVFGISDRMDATIAWGDNASGNNTGPDNMRFIFTEAIGGSIAGGQNGLEIARMTPQSDGASNGMLGVGDFTTGAVTHKLHVKGNGRFESVPTDPSSEYIMLAKQEGGANDVSLRKLAFTGNSADVLQGDGTWGTVTGTGTISANNGLSIAGGTVQLGNNVGAATAALLNDREVPLHDYNLRFTDGAGVSGKNKLSIGGAPAANAKLTVRKSLLTNEFLPAGILVENEDVHQAGPYTGNAYGIVSKATGENRSNYAGQFISTGAKVNYGLEAEGNSTSSSGTTGIGVRSTGIGGTQNNIGVQAFASPNSLTSTARCIGVQGSGSTSGDSYGGYFTGGSTTTAANLYGIYAETAGNTSGSNYAGYFNGDVFTTGAYLPSDQNLKTNVVDYDSSLYVLSQLQPKSFAYDNSYAPQMSLSNRHQYGLIAQEVDQVLPSLVKAVSVPAALDSLGGVIHPAKVIKGVDYEQLIPILIGGVQEQQAIIQGQDSLIDDLNTRLTSLENCLSGILPFLCELGNTAITHNTKSTQQKMVQQLEVILDDNANIVLEQNVPNPFAEQTVIEYFIPEAVSRAQIHFYNTSGQLINSVEIEEMGSGKLTVFASDLSAGTYTYSLVADGKVISTKKMVKTH